MKSEDHLQLMFCKWMEEIHPGILYFAVPNGKFTSSWATMKVFQWTGLKKGVPDLVIPEARQSYHGLFIEMKNGKKGRISPEQREWQRQLIARGYHSVKVDNLLQGIELVNSYLDEGV